MDKPLEENVWWDYMHEGVKELLKESLFILKKVEKWDKKFHDYSFVVFPAAKAYEGFLKTLFLDLGFITKEEFAGKRFRVGKSLNPSLDRKYHKENVYKKIVSHCNGQELADDLWNTWKNCRNVLFHWFPNEKNAISLTESKEKVGRIIESMNKAFEECKI